MRENLAENCKHCPRNLGQCITVKYCRETESVLELAPPMDRERELMIERYYKLKNME